MAEKLLGNRKNHRIDKWSASLAVGRQTFVENVHALMGSAANGRKVCETGGSSQLQEALIPIKNFGEISVRTVLEEKLTRKINKERHKLVRKILAKDQVQKEVSRIWEQMHRVEQINDFPLVWVRVVPQAVGLLPPTAVDADSLKFGLQMVLKTDTGLSGKLPVAPVTPLPDAKILEKVSNRFQIRVPFTIETSAVNAYLAKKETGRSRIVAKDITVTLERAQVLSLDKEIQNADRAIKDLIAELTVPPWVKADLSVKSPKLNRLGVNHYGVYGDLQLNGTLQAALDFPEPGIP